MSTKQQAKDKQEFLNCELEFECPKDWFGLDLTNKAGIKHCNQCQQDVHLCINQEELDEAIAQKHCIAFFKEPSLPIKFKLNREKCEADTSNPYLQGVFQRTVGIPKNLGGTPSLSLDSFGVIKKFTDKK